MNVYERIQALRKDHLEMTQEEFSSKIKISRSNLGSIEVGRINVTDRVISDICSVFDVNEEWLRTGNGDMFIESDDANIVSVSTEYGLDDLSQIILKAYVSMDAPKRTALNDFVKEMADRVMEQSAENVRVGINEIIMDSHATETVKRDLTGKAANVFVENFPYIGIGNVDQMQSVKSDEQERAALHAMLDAAIAKEKKQESEASIVKELGVG